MENLCTCDSSDGSNDADSKDRQCKSDDEYKTTPSFRDSDFDVSDSGDSSDSDDSSDSGDSLDSMITKPLRKKFISAVNDENKDMVKSLLDEFFNASDVFLKSWSSDSHPETQENKVEIWRDATYMATGKNTKHSEDIVKLLLDSNIIRSLETETEMDDLLVPRLIRCPEIVGDKTLRLIEMLLKSGNIDVNARDEKGKTALHLAKTRNLISLLIRYGADVNKRDNEGQTPFMIAWNELRTILKEARTLVDLDAMDYNGHTALMIAARGNRPEVVELLLNAGASVNLSDHRGFTALHHALCTRFNHYDPFPRNSQELKKRKEILKILFDAKYERCNCSARNEKWIEERVKTIEMLLERPDINMNALSFEKFSPLDIAEVEIPEIPSSIKDALIKKEAVLNVYRQSESQSTSLSHLDVTSRLTLELLLKKVCEHTKVTVKKRLLSLIETFQDQIVSGKDQQGRTALHSVAISFSTVSPVDYKTYTLYEQRKSYLSDLANIIVRELITIGCSVNETDIYGRTPLHYANDISQDLLIFHGADASIKDKDGNIAMDEIPQKSSTNSSDLVSLIKAVIERNDETYFLRLMNNKQIEIKVQCVDKSQERAYEDSDGASEFQMERVNLKTVPRLLWENGLYAFRHPLVKRTTKEVIDLMDAFAKEIERLDPRFEIRVELVGSSNEGTKTEEPNEFDFCFVLTKFSELCEVSLSPELPTGFVRLKRKPTKAGDKEEIDYDSFFVKDGVLNTEKLNRQFTMILDSALVNIESQQSLDCNLELPIGRIYEAIKKVSHISMIKPLNFTSIEYISIDIVPCIHVDGWWPDDAISNVSDEIKAFGCHLIFDRPQELYPWVPYSESCARISFAKAESDMIMESCDSAREAYMIRKTMIIQSTSLLASKYYLKTCLLYCIEALTPNSKKASQLGLSLEEMESKFRQMDRYLWLKCLMKCHLEFVLQDFCPSYFLPDSSSPNLAENLKGDSLDWMRGKDRREDRGFAFPDICRIDYALYRCTSDDTSESCYQSPAPDPLWERFDRNQLISSLFEVAYK